MLRLLIALLVTIVVAGCSSSMGTTEYSLEPMVQADGSIVCCKATVYNSKDYDKLKFKFVKKSDGTIEAVLDESGVSASDPATVNAENNGKMLDAINQLIPKVTD
ncbi:hypothetical protein [Pseudoalteromonas piratica]|uniref:Lipoprotein n=1 Tax=Pseudoalteromonas piratica TaxID=1348114 RepID=A0A0A7EGK2_9GAMM|nr:hypothetical protein [Pseudoalteromonas piratica]AIY65186.1 hypothetical protein OM33_08460 [Pseudoalteromonas piratica]